MKRQFLKYVFAASVAATLAACGGSDDPAPAPKDLVQLAQSVPDASILVEAVIAAGLVDTLKSPGPFTVFVPTNAAFVAALAELKISKEALFANKALLTKILTYHVVPGKILKAQVPVGKAITTVQSETFTVDANLAITDQRGRKANITTTDQLASNGVVHLIDKVILPTDKDIVGVATGAAPEFKILVEALTKANLVTTLQGTGPFTVFAPTDAAFAAALTELCLTKQQLLDSPLLGAILTYHVVPGRFLKAGVPVATPITTVQGKTLSVSAGFVITDQAGRKANIIATDNFATNGVVHVIDKVILPQSVASGC